MRVNAQITLDKYEEANTLRELNASIMSYNMMSNMNFGINPIRTEICDNGDGTLEFRILDYEVKLEDIEKANKEAQKYLQSLDSEIMDMLKGFGGTN